MYLCGDRYPKASGQNHYIGDSGEIDDQEPLPLMAARAKTADNGDSPTRPTQPGVGPGARDARLDRLSYLIDRE